MFTIRQNNTISSNKLQRILKTLHQTTLNLEQCNQKVDIKVALACFQ